MAAEVEVQSEVGRSGGHLHLSSLTDSNNKNLLEISPLSQPRLISSEPSKPALGPKPRLTPKPFTVDRNTTIKPILAPKPQTKPRPESTRSTGYKPELPSTPKPQTPPLSGKPRLGTNSASRPTSTSIRTSKLNAGQTTKPVAQPFKPAPPLTGDPSKPISPILKSSNLTYSRSLKRPPSAEWSGSTKKEERDLESPTKYGTSITRAKSMGYLLQIGKEEEEKTKLDAAVPLRAQPRGVRPRPVSAIYPTTPTKTESPNSAYLRTERRPLSADLTSKFETAGLSLPHKTSAAKENSPESNLHTKVKSTSPQNSSAVTHKPTSNQSKDNVQAKDNEEMRGSSVKSRISLLLDSSTSPVTPAPGQASENTPTQTALDAESAVGVKQLIKQLTVDQTSPNQSPVLKPALKPRPLPLDLTKRFSPDPMVSLGDASDRHDGKALEKRGDDSVRTPSDEKTFMDLKDSLHQIKTPVSEGAYVLPSPKESETHTVRASVFENVVEKHSILMVDENKNDKPVLEPDEEGKLVTATYREPVSPSGPVRIVHAFDTVPAAGGNTAVSESIPSAQWEDKPMTLRSRRSEGTKLTPEKTSPEQISNAPRYLRVGALPKWTMDSDIDLETGMPKDKPRDVVVEDASAAAAKRLKTQQMEEQAKPRATYFALTGQMQENVSATSQAGDDMALSDPSAQWSSQGKVLPFRRNPSLDEAFTKPQENNAHTEAQRELQKQIETEKLAEIEFARLKERELQREYERQRQKAFEKDKQEFEEKQRAIEINKQLEVERLKHLEFEKQRQVELRRQRQMDIERQRKNDQERQKQAETERLLQIQLENQRQLELENNRQLELKKQKQEQEMLRHLEIERQKQSEIERQRQIEAERIRQIELEKQRQIDLENQRQIELKKQKQEIERQKQLEMEKQKQLEAEKQRQIEIQRQKQLEAEKQLQMELERQRQMELNRQKQAEIEKQRQIELEKQRQIEREKQKQIEAEKQKQREMERQKQFELEKQRQLELERQKLQEIEREKQQELERERQRQLERERREMERQRQREEERRQKELDKERKLMEKQMERQRMQAEAEEQERRQQAELQKQRERQQVLEMEKQRLREKMEKEQAEKLRQMALEQEMLRMRELDKEKERQKEMEREMERETQRELELQRQRDLEKQRQKQLDLERQELEKQRLRQQEQEKERQRQEELERMKELERRQLQEFEMQKQAERQHVLELEKRRLREKIEREEAERMRQIAKQQEAERQRLKDKQKKEEQERIRLESAALKPKVVDLDSILRNEQTRGSSRGDPSTRWKEPSPKSEPSLRPQILDIDTFTFYSQLSPTRDLFPAVGIQEMNPRVPAPPQNSGGLQSPVWTTSPQDPWELHSVEMSVDQPEQPTKPLSKTSPEQLLLRQEERRQAPQRRWSHRVVDDPFQMGSFSEPESKLTPSAPVAPSSPTTEQVWLPREPSQGPSRSDGPSHRRTQGSQELNRIRSRSMSRRSAPSSTAVESSLSRMRSRSAHRDQARDSWVQQKQNVSTEDESKDSETPVHETDSQYGTWETGLRSEDSLTPATPSSDSNLSPSPKKPTSPQTPADLTTHLLAVVTDAVSPPAPSSELLPFPDAPVMLLDNSALRSKAQLGKKRARTRPSRATKPAPAEGGASDDWLYKDSTDDKVENKKEDSDSEEQPKSSDTGALAASSQPQRVALFPGMDQSALMAQLKKRGDSDNQTEGLTPAPSQLSRSPKSPFLPRATRVLPPAGVKENGEEDSPQWLKELKSKKRLSQYESES